MTEELVADHRPSAYREGDITILRASALGGCTTSLIAALCGYTPVDKFPPKIQEAMDYGVEHEDELIQWAADDAGYKVAELQPQVEIKVGARIVVRGHADALVVRPDEADAVLGRVVEAKWLGQSTWDEFWARGFEGFERYRWQAGVYQSGLEWPVIYAVGNRETGEMKWRMVKPTELPTRGEIARRALGVVRAAEKAAMTGDLPPCDATMFPCPFFFLHDEEEPELVADPDLAVAIDEAAALYDAARAAEKVAQEAKAKAKANLDAVVGEMTRAETEGWKVTRSKPSRRFDQSKFREANPEMYEKFKTETPGHLVVTRKKD